MARRDWKVLQQEYKLEFSLSGISIKAWCEKKGINYNTARRYLQVITSDDKNDDQCAKSGTKPQDNAKRQSEERQKDNESTERGKKEKAAKSKGKDNKKDVISKSDQLITKSRDQNEEKESNAQFLKRVLRIDTSGQRDESGKFTAGNQFSTKHNGYAQRLNDPDAIFDAANSEIDHEIVFCRARVLKAMETYKRIGEELENDDAPLADRVRLYELYVNTDSIVDRNMARVESLLRTKAQVKKLDLEAERIAQESAGLGTAIADIVSEIQDMDSNGFVLND